MRRSIGSLVCIGLILCSQNATAQPSEAPPAPAPPASPYQQAPPYVPPSYAVPAPFGPAPAVPPVPHPALPGGAIQSEPSSKVEHLLKAAEHLDAAGLTHLAAHARSEAARVKKELQAKQGELMRLHTEVQELTAGSARQVLVKVHIVEVSLNGMRTLGFDPKTLELESDFCECLAKEKADQTSAKDAIARFEGDPDVVTAFMKKMSSENRAKVLAAPAIATVAGRPASLFVGGEVPFDQSNPTKVRRAGTQVEIVPSIVDGDRLRLELRANVTELDPALGVTVGGAKLPGFRVREIDTGVVTESGKTVVVGGPVQERVTMERDTDGKDAPRKNFVQTLFVISPELVAAEPPKTVTR